MKRLLLFAFLIFNFELAASDRITATITITNVAANGNTFTVNGNVRTWTNQIFTASSQILVTNTANWTKTNLFTHIALNPFANIIPVDTGSNTFTLNGLCGGALTVSASGTYASVSYSTQTCAVANPVGVPFANYYPSLTARTNTASQLVTDLNAYDANALSQSAPIAGQLVGLGNSQTITGQKVLNNANNAFSGSLSNITGANFGTNLLFVPTHTFTSVQFNGALLFTNDFGTNAYEYYIASNGIFARTVTGTNLLLCLSRRVVDDAKYGEGSLDTWIFCGPGNAIKLITTATNLGGWRFASASAGFSPFGSGSSFSDDAGNNVIASDNIGNVQIGADIANTTNIIFASSNLTGNAYGLTNVNPAHMGSGFIPLANLFNVVTNNGTETNVSFASTINFPAGADIAFGRFPVASLANGNNAAVPVGTNVFIEVSGPSGAFTICGIAGGRDGKYLVIVNQTGFDMTIAHQSGTDPTAANRIISMTGADRVTTGNGTATLIYSASASRWLLINFDP